MQVHLLAVGTRMPGWVEEGFRDYQRRMPRELPLNLVEVPLARRTRGTDIDRAKAEEAGALRRLLPANCRVIALDVCGKSLSTEQWAAKIPGWRMAGQDVALLVGGPDGLDSELLALAHERWSLSALTLPHPLVRIVVAEQLYRAWCIFCGHPYHR